MKTRCSKCHTRYEIDLDAVLAADGMARCFRCGTVFNALTEEVGLGETADRHRYQRITPDGEADATHEDLPEVDIPWTDLPVAEIPEFDGGRPDAHATSAADALEQDIPGLELPDLAAAEAEIPEPGSDVPDAAGPDVAEADSLELVYSVAETRAHGIIERAHPAPPPPAQAPQTSQAEQPEPAAPMVEEVEPAGAVLAEAESTEPGIDQRERSAPQAPAPDASPAPVDPPFKIPEDLEPLQPVYEAPMDVLDTLTEKRSWRGFFYGVLALLLLIGLGLQLAWQHRSELIARYPVLQPVCQHIDCRPSTVRAPQQFRVLHRNLSPTPDRTGSLTLKLRFRNEAQASQPLPDIQLTLLDTIGSVVIRRRLAPREYLVPAPAPDTLVAAGEVVTIDLDFKDPGHLATSFEIDFF